MKTQAARLDWSHESSGFILTIQRLAQPPTGSWSLGPWGCPVLASHLYPPSPRSLGLAVPMSMVCSHGDSTVIPAPLQA